MDRSEMIEALMAEVERSGAQATSARQRLQRMSTAGLQRELLLRGLAEYDDSPASEHEDDDCDYRGVSYSLLGLAYGPVYID